MQKKNLVDVKRDLAAKQERLAKVCGSKPRRTRMLRLAEKLRRQAADLAR